ncbi:carbohydrate ABC transporter permease [Chelativorans sp. AA-79]|uniref:carbohydrate ABC transporter permease n=1 Tax=Chelativorans sp. AA-79 TaxID=3028735 RepID=UPI0023F9363E|nr:carbohydrate ABC transporter permease [Chelativorans sp. AA-79]WEX08672.1 carbohydrate ABC transporter permease [Chelativorans sp. AA-79]
MLALKGRELWIGYALLALSILLVVLPFLWILMTSFKYQIDIYTGAWVFTPTLFNYADVLFGPRSDFLTNVGNSLIVAAVSTVVVLVIGTLAAYSLAKLPWAPWISKAFLGWMLLFHMIPVLTIVGPWYLLFQEIGLYATLTGLILTHITINLPMTVWLMMAFFRDIPVELEEAARVDGCRRAQAFRKVVLPLAVPGLIAAGVIAFVFSWNEFSIALNLTSRGTATVPVGIAQFAQQYEIQNGQMAAASMISTIPAMLLMLFGQRFVVQGLTLGSVK